ncbi:hypothetical protein [Nocardia vulneris]|uniref:hypothetical protein n=1 Tax=Nocardia vulneris TaxID=1141657 RepID=UPI0006904F6C|nr:hypothetical protein [Nocardia vulneris]
MPKIRLNNISDKTAVVFVEPWADGHWMRPRETFTVEFDADSAQHVLGDTDVDVSWHDQGLVVGTAAVIEVVAQRRLGDRVTSAATP